MATYNLTDVSNLFKIKYGKVSENTYNSANVLLGRCKKTYDFTGRQMFIPVPLSYSGGVGSGSLPTANFENAEDATFSRKKVYSRIQIDREAIKASMSSEGAFVKMTQRAVEKGVESYMRNASRILFNDGTGTLGVSTAAAAGGTATAPTIVISAATWKEANWEEKDYVNIESASTTYSTGNVWEVTAVAPTTRTITLARISGSVDLTGDSAAKTVTMQNSKNNDPSGLKGNLDATSSTLYGITVGRRWQATQLAAGGAGLTPDLLNQQMLEIERKCGKTPNLIVTSYTQFRKLLNVLEDQKQYNLEPRSADLKGKISFKGIEYMSTRGPIPVFPERFVEDDRVYLLNDNFIHLYHAPDFGWFDDDGTVFLRGSSSDDYEARYGGYWEAYIPPVFHGVITGLST